MTVQKIGGGIEFDLREGPVRPRNILSRVLPPGEMSTTTTRPRQQPTCRVLQDGFAQWRRYDDAQAVRTSARMWPRAR